MKVTMSIIIAVLIASIAGFWLGKQQSGGSMAPAASAITERQILYYKAPMDPNYRRDVPGKSPMGMDLVPVYADEAGETDAGTVKISPTVVNNMGVRTARVERGALARGIDTVGYIGYDEDTLHKISTRVDGWIEQLNIKATGDPVKKGEPLFELYSPTLVNAQEEYLAALQSRNTALHGASRGRLAALGISAAEIERLSTQRRVRQRVKIFAPADGVVTHLGVREGEYVTAASDIMSIGSLENVWLLTQIFERQASWVQVGQSATVTLDRRSSEARTGVVDYVYPELDPITRTVTARIRLDNEGFALKPNMFARARIVTNDIDDALHIPREALIRGGSVDRVVRVNDDGSFRSQVVTIGIESGERVQIISGLSVRDKVVTSGQFLIDSESNIDSALSKMDGSSADPHAGHDMSGHQMPSASEPMGEEAPIDPHAGHDMSGHQMPSAGEPMGEEAPTDPHAGHDMSGHQK